MTVDEALTVLNNATAVMRLSRQEHGVIVEAINLITEELGTKSGPKPENVIEKKVK